MLFEFIKNRRIVLAVMIFMLSVRVNGQTYPEQPVDQSYVPTSPNASAFESYGANPVSLFEGLPSVVLPVYQLKCGSLSLPISLSYNYNGLLPLQDAGWVGLGWNLNAGGVITRTVEGGVDNSENAGYNYGQYNLYDSIYIFNSPNLNGFLQKAYNNNLGYSGNSYDMAPDIFDAEFNGHSGKFFWINGAPYQLSYNKDLGISWPSPTSNFYITTADGTMYTFGAMETTTSYYYGGGDSTHITFTSAWHLTMIISADYKDTIKLNYGTYSWQQALTSYQTSYGVSAGSQADLGTDPLSYLVAPTIQAQVLQSITCRNARIRFVADQNARTDVLGTYPKLREIDIIDSITGNTVKKNLLSYEYFGQTSSSPASSERLALKTFSTVNTQVSSDSLTYVFKYINEFNAFPVKGTSTIDYWGYSNGPSGGGTILPPPSSPFYTPQPPTNANFGGANRTPNFTYASYGALDTVVYPAGGYTAFQYEQNYFYSTNYTGGGPGIRIKSSSTYSNNPYNPTPLTKNYTYLLDNGSTSGVMTNPPVLSGPAFVVVNQGVANNYYVYKAATNSAGVGGINPKFYYQKVSESITSGGETHKSDHYFSSLQGLFLDVRETKSIDYVNTVNTGIFTPISKTVSTYSAVADTAFYYANAYMDSEYVDVNKNPKIWYAYGDNYNTWSTYWVFPTSQQITKYDNKGDSLVTTVYFFFNPKTRNLAYTQQTSSDAQIVTKKFKYPEDYANSLTGNMVNARVLTPVLEQETWMKRDANDSTLIGGTIALYDQTIYKPVSTYGMETTAPIASLNNQTSSGGLYTSFLCDSRYVLKEQIQYDQNNNPSITNKASDMYVSYIWGYRHGQLIAQVNNAVQADIAYTSFEGDGTGNWNAYTGTITTPSTAPFPPTGSSYYNLTTSATLSKTGVTSGNIYIISYWSQNGVYSISGGTAVGSYVTGKTIAGWTYYEHKIQASSSTLTISGNGAIDEVRLYPAQAQMTTYTYTPLIGVSSQCDVDNRITYYQYDGFGRLKVVLDQDHNIIKTMQYHYVGETNE